MKLDTLHIKRLMDGVLDKYNAKKISKKLMKKEMAFLFEGLTKAEELEKRLYRRKGKA